MKNFLSRIKLSKNYNIRHNASDSLKYSKSVSEVTNLSQNLTDAKNDESK